MCVNSWWNCPVANAGKIRVGMRCKVYLLAGKHKVSSEDWYMHDQRGLQHDSCKVLTLHDFEKLM